MRAELLKIWPEGVRTVLDLGCRDCWHTTALPGVIKHVGVDIWPAALQRGVDKGIPFFEPKLCDALEAVQSARAGEFDAVLAIDLLEHLPSYDAPTLLGGMMRVAAKIAIVWTTLNYIEQGPCDVDGNYNPHEKHLWGPTLNLFREVEWQFSAWPSWHETRGGAILAWHLNK